MLGIFIWNYYLSYVSGDSMINVPGRQIGRILELERTSFWKGNQGPETLWNLSKIIQLLDGTRRTRTLSS